MAKAKAKTGTKKPATSTKSKKTKKAKDEEEESKPKGRGRRDPDSGMNVCDMFMHIFDNQEDERLSNEEIAEKLNEVFPEARGGNGYDPPYINYARGLFNRGALRPQVRGEHEVPDVPVPEYDAEGNPKVRKKREKKAKKKKSEDVADETDFGDDDEEEAPPKKKPVPKKKKKPAPKKKVSK